MPDSNIMLTTTEVGKFLHLCPSTVRNWADSGILPCYVLGKRGDRRFKKAELELYLELSKNTD
jgi:excisionase family DNA binding protein